MFYIVMMVIDIFIKNILERTENQKASALRFFRCFRCEALIQIRNEPIYSIGLTCGNRPMCPLRSCQLFHFYENDGQPHQMLGFQSLEVQVVKPTLLQLEIIPLLAVSWRRDTKEGFDLV